LKLFALLAHAETSQAASVPSFALSQLTLPGRESITKSPNHQMKQSVDAVIGTSGDLVIW